MKRVLRWFVWSLLGLLGFIAVCGALFAYFVYSPTPIRPGLSGAVQKGSIQADGIKRTYISYVPRDLPKGAPLVLVMHGSGQSADDIRVETGYAFERLADQHGFAIAYPDAYSFDWNDCGKVGDYQVNGRDIDDIGFLNILTDKLVNDLGTDKNRVFATGVSAGGFMSLRLAVESPTRFRAVAAVSASVQVPQNFRCKPAGTGTSVMIMNGTKDPLVPYNGGEVNLLGLFYKCGDVLNARTSAQYFADLNKITATPTAQTTVISGVDVEQVSWKRDARTEVELVTIHGGGHGLPQPYYRRARLLGPSPMAPNGAEMIWEFFKRQQP
ncbi:alpha/beta hydrolase family esterase [Undibacterium sp. Ji49W]|uniref:extracellular catalytic domain type 1 short-chain-length polyhydroxyalkanoate depolymerase n=1 Tax=Undibacterium sp. Ji49W TaxID=3413040 RepID=UPI003BF25910